MLKHMESFHSPKKIDLHASKKFVCTNDLKPSQLAGSVTFNMYRDGNFHSKTWAEKRCWLMKLIIYMSFIYPQKNNFDTPKSFLCSNVWFSNVFVLVPLFQPCQKKRFLEHHKEN